MDREEFWKRLFRFPKSAIVEYVMRRHFLFERERIIANVELIYFSQRRKKVDSELDELMARSRELTAGEITAESHSEWIAIQDKIKKLFDQGDRLSREFFGKREVATYGSK
jgi:hypothetical protein